MPTVKESISLENRYTVDIAMSRCVPRTEDEVIRSYILNQVRYPVYEAVHWVVSNVVATGVRSDSVFDSEVCKIVENVV